MTLAISLMLDSGKLLSELAAYVPILVGGVLNQLNYLYPLLGK